MSKTTHDKDLVAVIQAGTPAEVDSAVRELAERHRRLILKHGFAYRLPEGVALAAGAQAVWEAAKRFDVAKDVKFVTYLTFWVRKQIQKASSAAAGRDIPMSALAGSGPVDQAESFEAQIECRSTSGGGLSAVARADLVADLAEAMSEVEEEIRVVLEAVAVGKRVKKIAEELSLSQHAVSKRRKTGLRILRRKMKGYS